MDSFIWKGKDSYLDYGIIITQKPPLSKAERNIEEIQVPGRNGDLVIDYNTYQSIDFQITCNMRFSTHDIEEIKAWLDGFDNLIFSWQNDRYYKARLINRIDIAQSFKIFGEFTLIFKAQPHAYTINNSVITLTPSGNIVNSGTYYSEPILKLYGTGDVELAVNSNMIYITNIVDYITIDSTIKDCYKDDLSCNYQMTGDFPILQIGTNGIAQYAGTGTITKIEVTPNFRWL